MLTPIEAASARFSALAASIGVKHIKAFLETCPPSHLFKHYFILPTSQGRSFHTLSNNILFLQPVRAEKYYCPDWLEEKILFEGVWKALPGQVGRIKILLEKVWKELLHWLRPSSASVTPSAQNLMSRSNLLFPILITILKPSTIEFCLLKAEI